MSGVQSFLGRPGERLGSRLTLLTGLAVAASMLGGCSQLPQVQPWEKGMLAKPYMLLDDDALDQKFVQHVYFSKESASGGAGVGGGGCGCN